MKIRDLKRVVRAMPLPRSARAFVPDASPGALRLRRRSGRWEIFDRQDGIRIQEVFDSEEAACEAYYRRMKKLLSDLCGGGTPLWQITDVRITSRSSADITFGTRTVRLRGELMAAYFLAVPDGMFWLAEEDRDIWPWRLDPAKQRDLLTERESAAVIAAVEDYFRGRPDPVFFLTRQREALAFALAGRIRDGKTTNRRAIEEMRSLLPGLPARLYRDLLTDAQNGVRWYPEDGQEET